MSDDILLSELDGRVLVLTLNRPKSLNALNPALMRRLTEALLDAADDARVGCVLIKGNGRAFCAGGDIAAARDANDKVEKSAEEIAADELRQAKRGPNTPEIMMNWLRRSGEASRLLHQMPKPTVAALHGSVVGAGLGLAGACDFRVVSTDAKFSSGFVKVGYSGDFGGTYFLTRLLGTALAREIYMLDRRLTAEDAERLGLATSLVSPDDLISTAMAMAHKLAKSPPIALRYIKKNLNAAEEGSLESILDLEVINQNRCGQTEDHKEALKAFFEKREPQFRGV